MFIFDKKIQIRPLEEEDIPEFYFNVTQAKMRGEVLECEIDSEFTCKKEFQKTGFWEADQGKALILEGDHQFGVMRFEKKRFNVLDLAFLIFDKKEGSKEHMARALSLFSSYLFSNLEMHRQEILIPNYDRNSIHIAQESGFTFEGILRKVVFHKGQFVDLCIYALLREECKNLKIF